MLIEARFDLVDIFKHFFEFFLCLLKIVILNTFVD